RHTRTTREWPCFQLAEVALFSVGVNRNTVYLDRAIAALGQTQAPSAPELLRYLSPLSRKHINLTGNSTWPRTTHKPGRYRPLRHPTNP
ncbi:Tn3 family transposase, partial [Cryobacterium sp. 10I1]|uniref:Tn3 family transposase n=1 Tax=Cryobacterium sp. 10I1 TaxID=3048578 RepID=UPI002B22828D